jgi:UDP-2,4-diacetamido-2,4,6-trideoxy-beta-L-altropyranose hydrolase
MKLAFRTDASLEIGAGHVMRCLTLADALATAGAHCCFVSREYRGHLFELIRRRGHELQALPGPDASAGDESNSDWQTDCEQTRTALQGCDLDALIVDHYGLDAAWETGLADCSRRLFVIDDLADRPHRCDLLLDQNLDRRAGDYAELIPSTCQLMLGPQFALLRPDFARLRDYSLRRREHGELRRLLVNMGGTDLPNATSQVLSALHGVPLRSDSEVIVIVGAQAPWLQQVRELAARLPWKLTVKIDIDDMAYEMAESDLAIGAAGSSSWERCCLGLPALTVVLSANQMRVARALEDRGAAASLSLGPGLQTTLLDRLRIIVDDRQILRAMSASAREVTDGQGTGRVIAATSELIH